MKALYQKYERFLMPAMLVVGLAADFFTFKNIRIETSLMLLGAYFILAGLAITYIHLYDKPGIQDRHPVSRATRVVAQMIVQFAFGALLSASFVFYWFSGTVAVSWPLILIFALLMVSNDVLRHYFERPVVQISVYFFTAFSLLSLILPVAFNSIAVWHFVYAGILSLIFISFYIAGIARLVPSMREKRARMFIPVLIIFAAMNAFYFFNVIPPIPLSVREAGVYHDVRRSGSDYLVQAEKETFWQRVWPGQKIHAAPGERLFVFASIFAPADLNTTIVHEWQYYDASAGEWVSKDRLTYPISGGRVQGYRGYTLKTTVQPGKWRVDVETQRGQVLGRVHFTVESVAEKPELEQLTR